MTTTTMDATVRSLWRHIANQSINQLISHSTSKGTTIFLRTIGAGGTLRYCLAAITFC